MHPAAGQGGQQRGDKDKQQLKALWDAAAPAAERWSQDYIRGRFRQV
jgi:hypothetical protein